MSARCTALVTGATSGVGRSLAQSLAVQGMRVWVHGRSPDKVRAAVGEIRAAAGHDEVEPLVADLGEYDQVRGAAAAFVAAGSPLHVLVNNAGVFLTRRNTNAQGHERTLAVNHLGHYLLTRLLQERLVDSAPARVVHTSSDGHRFKPLDLDDLHTERRYLTFSFTAYARSKLANILFSDELARRLEGAGVTSNAFHPGGVGSGFATNNGWLGRTAMAMLRPVMLTPEQGAVTGLWLASSPEVEGRTGGYWAKREQLEPSHTSPELATRLWDISADLVGLSR